MPGRISITIDMAMPEQVPQEYCRPSLEEKVRRALDMIDSGHESPVEWAYVKRVYASLRGRSGQRAANIRKMIEPMLQKYDHQVDDRSE